MQDAPSWLADHGGWPRRQASATKTGALTRPAAEPAQAFFRLLVHFKAATGLGAGKKTPAKGQGATPLPGWLKFKNPDAPAVKREAEEGWGGRI